MRSRWLKVGFGTLALSACALGAYEGRAAYAASRFAPVRAELDALSFPAYAPQKVVYHVNGDGAWFDRAYVDLLGSIRNHVNAVGPDKIDVRIVLQGRGLKMLADAPGNDRLKERVDWLRARGVRFEICRNSLIDSRTAPSELYGVEPADVIPAAVAEIASLQGAGYVYIRP